jgi:hypothetical protein
MFPLLKHFSFLLFMVLEGDPAPQPAKKDVQSYSTWKVAFTDLSRNAP